MSRGEITNAYMSDWMPVGYVDTDVDRETLLRWWINYKIDELMSMFEVDGLPDTIPERYLKRLILTCGAIPIGVVDGKLYASFATFGGKRDAYYIPRTVIVSNPYIPWFAEIDTISDPDRLAIWENDTQRAGLLPLLRKYGSALVDNYITMRMITINARCPAIVSTDDRTVRSSAEEFFARLKKGAIGIVTRKGLTEALDSTPYADSGKTTIKEAIEAEQYWSAALWNRLGLNANWNAKREAIRESEAGLNEPSLLPLVDEMFRCWTRGAERVSELFADYLPTGKVTVRRGSAWKIEEEEVMRRADDPTDVPVVGGSGSTGGVEVVPDDRTDG